MKERKQLVENNPMLLCLEIEKHVLDGWKIDENEPFNMIFNLHTIGLTRTEANVAVDNVFPPLNIPEVRKQAGRPKKV